MPLSRGKFETGRHTDGVWVRVIEYTLEDMPGAEPLYRLVTTILDPEQAPADELAALYHERWEIETALGEFITLDSAVDGVFLNALI